jgi:NADPH:quinone reductase-like Zn-dependent oxidoreductase
MNIENKTVLITGANRGIGRALVDEALRRGAKRVYAGTRSPLQHSDKRVSPLTLDVTNLPQIQRAVDEVGTLDVLINNAGVAIYDDLSNLDVVDSIGQGVTVHGVFLGPIDTDMNRGFDIPKASTESAARGIFNGLENSEEDIFPDPASQSIAEGWRGGIAKALERQFSVFVPDGVAKVA